MQGRFKRDGSAAAESEPRGGSDRGQSTQHARNTGPAKGRDKERAGASPTASTSQDGAAENAEEAPAKSSAPTGPGSRIALRNWRISTRLVALLTLPVVAATSLGAMRINSSMDEIEQLDNMKLLTEMTKHATRLATALQNERDQSAGPLTHGGKATDYDVRSHRENTDRARQVFLEGTRDLESADEQALDGVRSNVRQITSQLYTLGDIRKEAYQDDQSVSQTIDAYSQLIEQLLDLSTDMAQATSNPDMIQRTRALAAFSSAKEYASIQRAVIAAALLYQRPQLRRALRDRPPLRLQRLQERGRLPRHPRRRLRRQRRDPAEAARQQRDDHRGQRLRQARADRAQRHADAGQALVPRLAGRRLRRARPDAAHRDHPAHRDGAEGP